MTTRDEALAALTAHREAGNVPRGQPDPITLQIVADCLNVTPPATWDDIGRAVGQAKPNAHRKYAPHLVETRHWTVKGDPGTETPPLADPMDLDRAPTHLHITGSVNNRDYSIADADMWAWEQFMLRVRELAARPEYASLELDIRETS